MIKKMFEKGLLVGSKVAELFMNKGDMKYLILYELKNKPMHGYEIMNAIKNEFANIYSPSPGTIYPTLQMLEEQGLVKSSNKDNRKIYSITSEGKKFLKENKKVIAGILKSLKENKILPQIEKITNDFKDITKETIKLAVESAKEGSKDIKKKMKKTSGILKETLKEITDTWKG